MNTGKNEIQALSVTDLNRYIKALICSDEVLSSVAVRGEISNFKRHSAGHLYFTLKDGGGEISAIMFRGDAARMKFIPADGMRVVAYGNIDVYEKTGKYQIYVRTMLSDGIGAMAEAYERLKRQLEAEGLFAPERKKPLPRYPKKIGVITAPTGAAIRDILNITGRRYPKAEILIYPSLVQGAEAPLSLRTGVEFLNAEGSCDLIILGRGGGSIEDLWAFNDEALARTVAASKIPIISAVGHETDFTLCDFVADLRAPTPSAAAEIAVPDVTMLRAGLDEIGKKIEKLATGGITFKRNEVMRMRDAIMLRSPEAKLLRMRQQVVLMNEKLNTAADKKYERRLAEYTNLTEKLVSLNPLSILGRGYGAIKNDDGAIIGRVSDMEIGQNVSIIMSDGEAKATIISVETVNNKENGGNTDVRN